MGDYIPNDNDTIDVTDTYITDENMVVLERFNHFVLGVKGGDLLLLRSVDNGNTVLRRFSGEAIASLLAMVKD